MSSNNHVLGGRALPATIYLFIALTYFMLDSMGFNVYIIRVLYGLYYLLSVYYFIKVHVEGTLPKFIKALDLFLIVVAIYVIVDIIFNGFQPLRTWGNADFLWWHVNAVVPLYSFYYFGKKNYLTNQWFTYVFIFCLITVYIMYVSNIHKVVETKNVDASEITNNVGYIVVALLPMTMFFSKSKIQQYICIGMVAVLTILSFKRGAVLCFVVSIVFFVLKALGSRNKTSSIARFGTLILTIIGLLLLYYFIEGLFQSSDYFVERVDSTIEGNSSSRNIIYGYYWDIYIHGDFVNIIFGRGVLATIHSTILGIEAHNDWLEYIFDLGIVGVLFYFRYWVIFIKEYFKSKRGDYQVSLALGIIVITYLIRTMVSMSFYDMPFYSNIVLGYCIAMNSKNTNTVL